MTSNTITTATLSFARARITTDPELSFLARFTTDPELSFLAR